VESGHIGGRKGSAGWRLPNKIIRIADKHKKFRRRERPRRKVYYEKDIFSIWHCRHGGGNIHPDRVDAGTGGDKTRRFSKESVMSKTTSLVIRAACLVIVGCFFFSYFVISCSGMEVNISGMEAAFGIDKGDITLDPEPLLLLIPAAALVVLLALRIPSAQKKEAEAKPVGRRLPVACGAFGLTMLSIAYNGAIGKIGEGMGSYVREVSSIFHTGFGFKASVFAFIVMAAMPFLDKFALNNKEDADGVGAGESKIPESKTDDCQKPAQPLFYEVTKETTLNDSLSLRPKTVRVLNAGEEVKVSNVLEKKELGGKWALVRTQSDDEGWCLLEALDKKE
jgi:hypothetical protein